MNTDNFNLESLLELAEQGNQFACYELGWMYLEGKKIKQNYSEAANWFVKATALSSPRSRCIDCTYSDSCYQLAQMHQKGQGFKQSEMEAANWFCRGAPYNYDCLNALAELYTKGIKAQEDVCEFAKLYYKIIEKGDVSPKGEVSWKKPWYRKYKLPFFVVGGLVSMMLLAWYDWVMVVNHGIATKDIMATFFGLCIGWLTSSISYQLDPNERVSGVPFPSFFSSRKSYFIGDWDDDPFSLFPFTLFSLPLNTCYFGLALLAISLSMNQFL